MQEDIEFKNKEQEIENAATTEMKLDLAIGYMRLILSEGDKVKFRLFWKIKKICLDLFKLDLHPTTRNVYWDEYTKILTEAHYLQKMSEEQTNYKIEQITLALSALEKELLEKEERIEASEIEPLKIEKLDAEIGEERKELAFLNNAKDKLLALREEVLSQEIRIGQKNKLLGQISKAGDQVFPRRKQLISSLTRAFFTYVEEFSQTYFDLKEKTILGQKTPFNLKKMVREAQDALKMLPISNEVYRKVRAELSACWDVITIYEKIKREEAEKEREEFAVQQKEREKVLGDVKKKQEESKEKVLSAIERLEGLLATAREMPLDHLENHFQENALTFDPSIIPRKVQFTYNSLLLQIRDVILSKKIDVSDEETLFELEPEVASFKEDLQRMIQDARREISRCGLDVDFAMQLKGIVADSKKCLSLFD